MFPRYPIRNALITLTGLLVPVLGVQAQQFAAGVALPGTTFAESVAVGDFNNDGRPDILAVTASNTSDVLYVNQGNQSFTSITLPASVDGLSVATGDLDGDGDIDAFVAAASGVCFIYRNNGGLSFTVVSAGGLSVAGEGVALADLDGDADLDAAVATGGGNPDVWYRNTGSLAFTQVNLPLVVGTTGTFGSDLAAGDINNDGKTDLYVSTILAKDVVYIGDGIGNFTPLLNSTSASGYGTAIGKLKSNKFQAYVASTGNNDYYTQHVPSNNSYQFTVVSPVVGPEQRTGVALADYDADGDVDAFITKNGAADRLLKNSGTAAFSLDTFLGSTGNSRDCAAADFDADGDIDVVVATSGAEDLIHYNNRITGPGPDTDGDGTPDNTDTDDDNDGVADGTDPARTNPDLCGDSDGDGCDDCAVGTDNFGPLSDRLPNNDGTDTDADGICNAGDLDDDNDGLPDTYETANGLNPLVNDAGGDLDNDGLTNLLEYQSGNNPSSRDSDMDGMSDGWEYHNFAVNKAYVLPSNSHWRFLDNGANLGSAYQDLAYNDTLWKTGSAELGYGDGGERTLVSFGPNPNNKYITTYFRRKFIVHGANDIQSAVLQFVRDDGVCMVLNGSEVARDNLPSGTLTHTTPALAAVEGTAETTYISSAVNPYMLVDGENIMAAELHQHTASSPDISFNAYLEVTYPPRQAHPLVDNDGDGASNYEEFVSGTNPNDASSGGSRLNVQNGPTSGQQFVFTATRATGTGYSGLSRYFTVEYRDSLTAGTWTTLPGYANILGNNQSVAISISGNTRFYRTKVVLQ